MLVILYIWTVVGFSNAHGRSEVYDWRYMGEYGSYPNCIEAVRNLKLANKRFLCQPTGRASVPAQLPAPAGTKK